jgi:hypothetical protein
LILVDFVSSLNFLFNIRATTKTTQTLEILPGGDNVCLWALQIVTLPAGSLL